VISTLYFVSLRLSFSVKYITLYSCMCNISPIISLTKNQILLHALKVCHTCPTQVKSTTAQITLWAHGGALG
jgi:hypothetical protein